MKLRLTMLAALEATVLLSYPASELYVSNKVAQVRAEVTEDLSQRIAQATNWIPERISAAAASTLNASTQHVADVRAEILSAANAASEALSRATSATNAASAVAARATAIEAALTTERDARTIGDATLGARVDGVSSTAQSALARANAATNASAGLATRVNALESGAASETIARVAADAALEARIGTGGSLTTNDVKSILQSEVGGTNAVNAMVAGGPYLGTSDPLITYGGIWFGDQVYQLGFGNGGDRIMITGGMQFIDGWSSVYGGTLSETETFPSYLASLAWTNETTRLQHALPYPTNAIPGSVVSGSVSYAQELSGRAGGRFMDSVTFGGWYWESGSKWGVLKTDEELGQIATNVYNSMPSTYAATNAVVSLNQSVQYASVAQGQSLTILAPSAVAAGIRDWVVYANCATNAALVLPTANYYMSDEAVTNDLKSGVTVLYFTEIPNAGYHLSRQELKAIAIGQ